MRRDKLGQGVLAYLGDRWYTSPVARRRWTLVAVIVALGACAWVMGASGFAGARTSVRASASAVASTCASPQVLAPRDPTNPLALPTAPGEDPLHGAHFFVDGPRHGVVAQAIESLLGLSNGSYTDSDTWLMFKQQVLGRLGSVSAATAHKVMELIKIGDQEETQSISSYSEGGGYQGVSGQVTKILCDNMSADPTVPDVPVLTTFFAYPKGQFCPNADALASWWPTHQPPGDYSPSQLRQMTSYFRPDVLGMKNAIGSARAVILIEIDSIGTIGCLCKKPPWPPPNFTKPVSGTCLLWLRELWYEATQFAQLPHQVSYMEAGSWDEGDAHDTAEYLIDAGIQNVRGFFTNDTHFNWSSNEIARASGGSYRGVSYPVGVSRWVTKLLAQLGRGRYVPSYVVNTAQNGRGPKLNSDPVKEGVEDLCNPSGRGLGREPTGDVTPTFDGFKFPFLDGFLWTGVPGRSHGTNCGPGSAPAGVFDVNFAVELATNANQRLGPGYPSLPY
jgi:hypothetical protein